MKIFRKILPLVAAAALALTGCTLPGERQHTEEDFNPDMDYADAEIVTTNEIINYTWFLDPMITAENIIVFDGSQVDTSLSDLNQMYRTLAVICQNGLYGFIDYSGNIIIKPKYRYYLIDPGGQIVLYNITNEKKGTREYCTMDKEGHVSTEYTPHKGSRIKYYYDEESKKVYASFESKDWAVEEYKDKKAVVCQKASVYEAYGRMELVEPEAGVGGFGVVADGEIVMDFEYDDCYTPAGKNGPFALKKGDKWGYFSSKGEKLIDFKCDGFFSSYNGENLDDMDYGHPYLFSEDLLAVSIGSSFGFYNAEGGCLVKSSEFAQARPVHHLKAWVCKDGYWGIISFGEDDEEPVTTTTTTTTTTAAWTQAYTTTEAEEEYDWEGWDDPEVYNPDEVDPAQTTGEGEMVYNPEATEDPGFTYQEQPQDVPVDQGGEVNNGGDLPLLE